MGEFLSIAGYDDLFKWDRIGVKGRRRWMMALVKILSQYCLRIQSSLSPWLEEELGKLTEKEQKLVTTLDLI